MTTASDQGDAMAYVTVLSTDSYLDGVLALDQSLRLCRSRHPLHVVVTDNVSARVRETLARAGVRRLEMSAVDVPEEIRAANLSSDFHRHWAGVFEKLLVFSLCQFRKVVYIDSDILVIKNVDALFDAPHMSAVSADRSRAKDGDFLNAGVMVIEPEPGLSDRLVGLVPEVFEDEKRWRQAEGRPPSMGVQSLINTHWRDWRTRDELHLDVKYNVLVNHLDDYVRERGYRWRGPGGIHVLHFIGHQKPWMTSGTAFVRQAASLTKARRHRELAAMVAFKAVLAFARLRLVLPSGAPARRLSTSAPRGAGAPSDVA